MLRRLIDNWVYGGFLAGALLLALTPAITCRWCTAELAIYLCLPAYMFHQFEEHDRDRFRLFVNQRMGNGREVLTPLDVFLINIPGVWGTIAISLTLALTVNVGYGLIAAYLLLVNAAVHIAQGMVTRHYNPGLDTAVAILLPLGVFTVEMIRRAGAAPPAMHLLGLGASLALHAAIVLYLLPRLKRATA
jgi:hypothetical protein